MIIKKFKIVSPRDVQSVDNVFETLLINLDHIISVKPIKMVLEDRVIDGFWIRTSNGKKYRAVEIPKELLTLLDAENELTELNSIKNEDLTSAQFLN